MIAWLFVQPIQLGRDHLWLVVPLCILVAAVYKTIRVKHLRDLPIQIVGLCLYIFVGLAVLGVAFHFLLEYAA